MMLTSDASTVYRATSGFPHQNLDSSNCSSPFHVTSAALGPMTAHSIYGSDSNATPATGVKQGDLVGVNKA